MNIKSVVSEASVRYLLAMICSIVILTPNIAKADAVTGIIGHWDFESVLGDTSFDQINSNNGLLSGGYSWAPGKSGNGSINFNGTGKNIIGDPIVLRDISNANGMTISLWVNPSLDNSAEQYLISKLNTTTIGWKLSLATGNNDGFQFSSDYDGIDLVIRSVDGSAKYNEWQHVTITWDGSTNASNAHIYVNGSEVGSYDIRTNATGNKLSDIGRKFVIGANQVTGRPFTGGIDDVKVFNRVLTASDVSELYAISSNNITLPIISNLIHNSISSTSAKIIWNTNEFATSTIFYGIDTNYSNNLVNTNFSLNHSFDISGLIPDTTYYYMAMTSDGVFNISTSSVGTFSTLDVDFAPPFISAVSSSVSPSRAQITWNTDEEANAKVVYGLNSNYTDSTSIIIDNSASHSIQLINLEPNTQYHYAVVSTDTSNNTSTSTDFTFITQNGIELCTVGCVTINNGDTWVLAGDSITGAHGYTDYLESYFHLRYPNSNLHFRNVGKGGTTIPSFLDIGNDYFDMLVYSLSPDIVSIMFGHNGPQDANVFENNLIDITDNYIIGRTNAKPIYFGPHPQNDSTGKPILGVYSDRITNVGTQRSYVFSDIWHYLFPIWLTNLNSVNPIDLQGADVTHPGPAGHLAIASSLLKDIGAKGEVSSAEIDASTAILIASNKTNISNITQTAVGIDFTRHDERLPMAYDAMARSVLVLHPEILDMNKYMLKITGLNPGNYDVYIDNILSATTTATELQNGWNMSKMVQGPIYEQLKEVLGRIRDKEGIEREIAGVDNISRSEILPRQSVARYKSSAGAYYDLGNTGEALKSMLTSELNEINNFDSLIHNASIPLPRNFSIRYTGIETDIAPPIISNGLPTGDFNSGLSTTTISVITDEEAVCKFGTIPNTPYSGISNVMNSINNTHSAIVPVSNGQSYAYYIRCEDTSLNSNQNDYVIAFNVLNSAIESGIVAKYSFDENVGLFTDDSVGINNGTLQNGVSWGLPKMGASSLDFDGLNDKVLVGTGLNNLPALTISFWAKIDGIGTQPEIMGTVNSNTLGWRLSLGTNNRLAFVSDYSTTDLNIVTANNVYNFGEWNYWTVTWDGNGLASGAKIYKNGVEVGYGTQTSAVGTRLNDTKFMIGNNVSGSRPFNGNIDELRVYNRALPANEVLELYNFVNI